jgi:GTP-binding protein HflX
VSTRALVVHPHIKSEKLGLRDPAARLEEAAGLASALDLEIIDARVEGVAIVKPGTLFGSGKVDELAAIIKSSKIELVIVDGTLSPVQQRNLEKAWSAKVLDRTSLILEIFGERAQTREGALQVELAHLIYQKSRLVRSWTHLERQRGGLGFVGGPGETQIEADRRMIDERVERIRRQLDKVVRTRGLHRKKRQKAPHPVVALVGYTNAGKSTLFNALTGSSVVAEDMLFATLDPTMRAIETKAGRRVILSDTVGFVSDLPTQLVAAFRATLEEVLEADVVVHVRDISSPETEAQSQDVKDVLATLGLDEGTVEEAIEVYNKIDLVPQDELDAILNEAKRLPNVVAVSAVNQTGIEKVLDSIEARLARDDVKYDLVLPFDDGEALAWLYEQGAVTGRTEKESGIKLTLSLSQANADKFEKRFPYNFT